MKLGFIGLGNMGAPMAANLRAAGFDLTVHDLNRPTAEPLLAAGAHWADAPRDVAAASDTVFTSLPGPPQVDSVVMGEGGLLAGARPGLTWIDMSTNSPLLVQRLAAALIPEGVAVLDAPVTGAVDGAWDGTLTIFVGGDRTVFDRHRQVFDPLGETVFYAGPLGAGLVAKLVTNLLWFVHAAAIGEALVLGRRAGLDLELLWTIIKSSAGNSWVAEHDVPAIFRGDYDPSFTLDLCSKDLGLIHGLGRQYDVPLEIGGLVDQIFQRARVQYGGDRGEMHVVKLVEDATGTSLQVPGF